MRQHPDDAVSNECGLRQTAQAHQHDQHQQADGEQIARRDRHQHIVAGHRAAAAAGQAAQQRAGILRVDLIKALGPAHTLIPRLAELRRLFVVDDRLAAVADAAALGRAGDGELDVLGQQVIRPAAVLADGLRRHEEARAGDRTVDAQTGARAVEEARFAQKPQRVARRYPIRAEVLRIAVAGQRGVFACGEHLVHLAHEFVIDQIVRVEHDERIIGMVALVRKNVMEQVIQRVALSDLHLVEALVHDRARLAGDRGSVVRAVVGDDVNIQQLRRIILLLETAYQVADDVFLVARRDDGRVAVQLRVLHAALFAAEIADEQIDDLVSIGRSEKYKNHELQTLQKPKHGDISTPL